MNGFHDSRIEDSFLFTSESVGEGHPGESAGGLCGRPGCRELEGGEEKREKEKWERALGRSFSACAGCLAGSRAAP